MYDQIINTNIFPNGGKIEGIKPSDEVLDFMKGTLEVNQKKRMGWKELIRHPLFEVEKNSKLPDRFRVTRNVQ